MNGLLAFYEGGSSFLHGRNPTLKLVSLMIPMLAVTLAFDPWTPVVLFGLGLLALRVLGHVPLRQVARPLALLFVLSALGLLGSNAFFYDPPSGTSLTVLWEGGPFRLTLEGLRVGFALTMRTMAIVTFSLIFVATTDPTDFVLSLIQHVRFPFRLGYGILVAYRFLPLWRTELDVIRSAHRIRGVGERTSLKGRWEQLQRYAVPLLAGAIRKAERVSIAMDSKAFGALPGRTYYRRLNLTRVDWAMLAASALITLLMLLALASAGLLVGYGVVPGD
ncbi:MAG: thiamine permease [Chloroflexi bacterium]|nr:thiamine permease [Chloroflexota bacterium]